MSSLKGIASPFSYCLSADSSIFMMVESLRIDSISDSPTLLRIPAMTSNGLTVLLPMHQKNASLRFKVLDLRLMKSGRPFLLSLLSPYCHQPTHSPPVLMPPPPGCPHARPGERPTKDRNLWQVKPEMVIRLRKANHLCEFLLLSGR